VALMACRPGSEAAPASSPEWPEGTVLAVDGLAILQSEVDELGALVALLYPEYTRPHLRRLTLTNRILPLLAMQSHFSEGRKAGHLSAKKALADLGTGHGDPPDATRVSGSWHDLGFELWSTITESPLEEWTGPIELPGRFVLVKIHERPPADQPRKKAWRLSMLEYPYLPTSELHLEIEAALDRSVLTVVDPAWREVVPQSWKHRMSGGS
jgi:hypothetical protein